MLDFSSELEKFLKEHVVLHSNEQNKLRKLKRLNIKRLKKGLEEYNEENSTSFKIVDNLVQGSMAMHTIIQNEEKDYDIDVAIIFDSEICSDKSALAMRKIVCESLEKKTKQFNAQPEIKTSCVRLHYEEGYHIDFAIYKKTIDTNTNEIKYEHSGSNWSLRDVESVEQWFNDNNKDSDGLLRKIVRLSKQLCSVRTNMPSGLIQTALCIECLYKDEKLDFAFYKTLQNIHNRLSTSTDITLPVDGGRSVSSRKIDIDRINLFKDELKLVLDKLEQLNDCECTRSQAIDIWNYVFEHDYWSNLDNKRNVNDEFSIITYNHTEQFIENQYVVYEKFDVDLLTTVTMNGFRPMSLETYLEKYKKISHGLSIECEYIDTGIQYDYILWKVKNEGNVAKRRNDIRGQIIKRGNKIKEKSVFQGEHYIECYVIKNDICVGIGHVDIPIGVE